MSRRFSDMEVKALIAEALAPVLARVAEQDRQIAALQSEIARLKTNSSNSSKPPSSDITKPPPSGGGAAGSGSGGSTGGGGKPRHIGGQEGHAKHQRPAFGPEQIDRTIQYELSDPGRLVPLDQWRRLQQIELVEKPFIVTEYQARVYRDPATGTICMAPFPPEVSAAGLCGPRLSAFIGYLKGGCRMSYSLIQDLLKDVMNIEVSTGQLAKVVQRTSAALAPAYGQLVSALPQQEVLGVDETGHYDRGKTLWTWCFRARDFAVFKIDGSRGSGVLTGTLGDDYAGTLVCDFFSPYRKFKGLSPCIIQFCLAHLIRDVRFLESLPGKPGVRFAQKLLKLFRKLFGKHHERLANPKQDFTGTLERLRKKILATIARAPASIEAQNIKERFRTFKQEYFTFLQRPEVDPTNNFTERTLRFAVIDRKLTQGTRGTNGQTWCQRIWSVLATCRLQKRSAFQFLEQTLANAFKRIATPQLLPAGP
jgi:transposase